MYIIFNKKIISLLKYNFGQMIVNRKKHSAKRGLLSAIYMCRVHVRSICTENDSGTIILSAIYKRKVFLKRNFKFFTLSQRRSSASSVVA